MNTKMQYILSGNEAKELDRLSIQEYGIPSLVLMERASLKLAQRIRENVDRDKKILILCGSGNNGGDGVACGRILCEDGYPVDVWLIGNRQHASSEMESQLLIAEKTGMSVSVVHELHDLENYDVIVDALFGIGLSRDITGIYREWVERINDFSGKVISVDIPSGVDATTGKILGIAVKADITVTFGENKTGLVLFPGAQYVGKLYVERIGFPLIALEELRASSFTYDKKDVKALFPKRIPRSNKGSYGKLLVIAGSVGMGGAALFAAKSAYLMGAGLVKVVTHENNRIMLQSNLPESLINCYDDFYDLTEDISWASAIVIGPGLGTGHMGETLLQQILTMEKKIPVLLDADALNLLAEKEEYFTRDGHGKRRLLQFPENFVLTPHIKEMSRLSGRTVDVIRENMMEVVSIPGNNATLVLKDARTIVANSAKKYINMSGNNALAKGGSGDVLSGMIGGLLARGMDVFEAATLGVYLHGLTADEYVKHRSSSSMTASDILHILPEILP